MKGEDWNKRGPGLFLILRSHIPRVQENLFGLCGLGVSCQALDFHKHCQLGYRGRNRAQLLPCTVFRMVYL